MPLNSISEINIGKVDGKNEFVEGLDISDPYFYDAFLLPDNIEISNFDSGEKYFIRGFRGTGKTSLLRWYAAKLRSRGFIGDIILFKSDLTPLQRQEISNQVGIEWADVSAEQMELIQDFKESWRWFFFHKIGELIKENPEIVEYNETAIGFIKLLGLGENTPFSKVLGFMPRLKGSKIQISTDIGFFKTELQGDFVESNNKMEIRLDALNMSAQRMAQKLRFKKSLYFMFDELEVFFHSEEQYKRDLRMVRDILFITDRMNRLFSKAESKVRFIAAVRSEVLDAMGAEGEEVNRLVHDCGVEIAWHHARRDLKHPLIEMLRRKISTSEKRAGVELSDDPIKTYFPEKLHGYTVDQYLLDRSFYKPRDLIWRLTLAKDAYPRERTFHQDVLDRTSNEYSSKLWDEIKYEMSAVYSGDEINVIEAAFSGKRVFFELNDVREWFDKTKNVAVTQRLLRRRPVEQILDDLYRLGAIGNAFKVGSRQVRNRWAFRGDPILLAEKRMELNSALAHHLSAVR